jgi:hypothetical protein
VGKILCKPDQYVLRVVEPALIRLLTGSICENCYNPGRMAIDQGKARQEWQQAIVSLSGRLDVSDNR